MSIVRSDKPFVLAGRTYQSRLLVGTGKYRGTARITALTPCASGIALSTEGNCGSATASPSCVTGTWSPISTMTM